MDDGWNLIEGLASSSSPSLSEPAAATTDAQDSGAQRTWTVELWAILIVGVCIVVITPILASHCVKGNYSSSYHPMSSVQDYFQSLYTDADGKPMDPDTVPGLLEHWGREIGFTWHHAPRSLTDGRPFARNTTFHFPPLENERYPLVAFPYPQKGKGGNIANFIRGMESMLNTTNDMATVPGFYVSLYDWRGKPSTRGGFLAGVRTVNEQRMAKALEKAFFRDAYSPPIHSTDPTPPDQDDLYPGAMEVMHSCYPPPDDAWPLCDDGGYWFYGVPGTGIFWNIPRSDIGAAEFNGANNFGIDASQRLMFAKRADQISTSAPQTTVPTPPQTTAPTPTINQFANGYGTLLCANKVDAMVRLYAMRVRNIAALNTEAFQLPPHKSWNKNKRHLVQNNPRLRLVRQPPEIFYDPKHNPAIEEIIAGVTTYLDTRGGGKNEVIALYRGVRAYQRNEPVDITAFRVMERSNAEPMTLFWLTLMLLLLFVIAVYALFFLPVTVYKTAKGQRTTKRFFIEHGCFIVGFLAFLMIFIFVITDALFRGFGYVTLDRLQSETGMNFQTIVRNAALGIEPKSNGLAMSQVFDIPMENMAINVDVDNQGDKFMTQIEGDFTFACVIMHTQPNKEAVWACEIMDLTRTPILKGQDTADFPAAALGLCGHPQPYDGNPALVEDAYIFKQGFGTPAPHKAGGDKDFGNLYPIQRLSQTQWKALPDCQCDPQVEMQVIKMTDNGFGPNCIFCAGRLSESLCVASALPR